MVSILIDDEILLRSLEADDADDLFKAIDHSRDHLRVWFPWVDATTKQEHSHQFIQQMLTRQKSQEGVALGIFHKMKLIGGMGMHHWDHDLKKAQIGYWISQDYEGKGIVYECLLHFIDFLFVKVGLNKVEIQFMPENTRSAALAKRIGFQIEGVIRHNYIHNGSFKDLVITGLLKSEWKALPERRGKEFKAT